MTAIIDAKVDKALREALHSVTRIEEDQVPPSLGALDDSERIAAVGLAVIITAYVIVDVAGSQWPVKSSVQRFPRTVATKLSTAQRLRLDPEEIYAYMSRTVLGPEQLEDVIPDEPTFTHLPVIVAGEALAIYAPKGMGMWDYLDRIESAIQAASALDAAVLPAAVMRAYMPKPQSSGQ
jgi:hypothetical protein